MNFLFNNICNSSSKKISNIYDKLSDNYIEKINILVSVPCNELFEMLSYYNATPAYLPNNKKYYTFELNENHFFIWSDFTGDEISDNEYLSELRRIFDGLSVKTLKFYIPDKTNGLDGLRTFCLFKKILKKNSNKFECYSFRILDVNKECNYYSFLNFGKLFNYHFIADL